MLLSLRASSSCQQGLLFLLSSGCKLITQCSRRRRQIVQRRFHRENKTKTSIRAKQRRATQIAENREPLTLVLLYEGVTAARAGNGNWFADYAVIAREVDGMATTLRELRELLRRTTHIYCLDSARLTRGTFLPLGWKNGAKKRKTVLPRPTTTHTGEYMQMKRATERVRHTEEDCEKISSFFSRFV